MTIKDLKLANDQSESAATVASIEDLLTEILLRLPRREVIRYKLVSKEWNSLITNSQLLMMRVLRMLRRVPKPGRATGLYLPWTRSLFVRPRFTSGAGYLPFSADKSSIPLLGRHSNILQSCNGLLLCSRTVQSSYAYCQPYYVYNPTTAKSFAIPELVREDEYLCVPIHSMSLAFDPCISPHYKVICVLSENESSYIYIYSSDTGLWTSSPERPNGLSVDSGSGVYWNGALHWIIAESYFKIKDQTLKAMPMPPVSGIKHNYYFGESYGHLLYTEIRTSTTVHDIRVCELRSDYSGWFVKYLVDLKDHLSIKSVLSVVHCEKKDDSFLVLQSAAGTVLRCNPVSGSFDKQEVHQNIFGDECRMRSYKRAFQYIEYVGDV